MPFVHRHRFIPCGRYSSILLLTAPAQNLGPYCGRKSSVNRVNAISVPPKSDIKLISPKQAANDPKRVHDFQSRTLA